MKHKNSSALLLILLTPGAAVVPDSNDVTIRSKSSGGDSYRNNYDQINWGNKSNTLH